MARKRPSTTPRKAAKPSKAPAKKAPSAKKAVAPKTVAPKTSAPQTIVTPKPKAVEPKAERDWSETLFLPKTDFPMRAGLPQKEPEILAHWQRLDLYRRLRKVGGQVRGVEQMLQETAVALSRLRERLGAEPVDRRVAVLHRPGEEMLLDGYLQTRCVELAVHIEDLALSVGSEVRASEAAGLSFHKILGMRKVVESIQMLLSSPYASSYGIRAS